MTNESFWNLIETARQGSRGSRETYATDLRAELSKLPPDQIVAFERIFYVSATRAYSWE